MRLGCVLTHRRGDRRPRDYCVLRSVSVVSSMRLRLLAIVVVVLVGLVTHSTHIGTGDEPHYLAIAHSLAFDRDLDLANNYGPAEPLIFDGGLEPGTHVVRGAGGIARPVHDIGMPLMLAPYVRVAAPLVSTLRPRVSDVVMERLRLTPWTIYRHLLSIAMIMVAGLLALEMFDAFMALGAGARLAFWTAALVALSPPLLIYGVLFFTEAMSALLCLMVFRRVVLQSEGAAWRWSIAGALTGLLLLVHVKNVGLSAALIFLGVLTLLRRGDVRNLLLFLGPFSALLALRTALNYHLWARYILSPHVRTGGWMGWRQTLETAFGRMAGMLFDQEFGLLPYAPFLLIGIFGIVALWRTRPDLLVKIAVVTGSYLVAMALPMSNAHGWTGGWSPAARFMVPIVPLLALTVVSGMRTAPRILSIAVVVVQIGHNVYFWSNPKNLWNDGDGIAAICTRGGARFCRYLPSFVDDVRP
jgi:hypothetical protein